MIANVTPDLVCLSDEQRRLLVACGAGAGMAAAYGVPLGGALFSLETLRGALALRFVLPSLLTAIVATGVSWAFLPDMPTYIIPIYKGSLSSLDRAITAGPVVGLVSILYVRAVAWADAHKRGGWRRVWAPIAGLGSLGAASIPFAQPLGSGRDVAEPAFTGGSALCCCGRWPRCYVSAAAPQEVCLGHCSLSARCSAASWACYRSSFGRAYRRDYSRTRGP